jgi:hypothetical protein
MHLDDRVNTPGRRISMYLVEVTELAKWRAGQVNDHIIITINQPDHQYYIYCHCYCKCLPSLIGVICTCVVIVVYRVYTSISS